MQFAETAKRLILIVTIIERETRVAAGASPLQEKSSGNSRRAAVAMLRTASSGAPR